LNNWWVPKNLKINEESVRSISDINLLDDNNDYASYKKIKLGLSPLNANLHSHNDLNPRFKIVSLSRILPLQSYQTILDAGCGVGMTTGAIADYCPSSKVLGVDVSIDAVDYARIQFPKANFEARIIDPSDNILGKFDAIFCFEFYPFTRNTDVEFQIKFIEYFIKNLNMGGVLVLYQTWKNLNSFASIFELIQANCKHLDFKVLQVAHPKLVRIFPYFLAFFFSKILQIINPSREFVRSVVVIKSN